MPTSIGTAGNGQIGGQSYVSMASPICTSLCFRSSAPHTAWPHLKHPSSAPQPRVHGLDVNAVDPGIGGLSFSAPMPLSSTFLSSGSPPHSQIWPLHPLVPPVEVEGQQRTKRAEWVRGGLGAN